MEVILIHVSLVKDRDFPALETCADLPRPLVIVFSRRVHDGESRKKTPCLEP